MSLVTNLGAGRDHLTLFAINLVDRMRALGVYQGPGNGQGRLRA